MEKNWDKKRKERANHKLSVHERVGEGFGVTKEKRETLDHTQKDNLSLVSLNLSLSLPPAHDKHTSFSHTCVKYQMKLTIFNLFVVF